MRSRSECDFGIVKGDRTALMGSCQAGISGTGNRDRCIFKCKRGSVAADEPYVGSIPTGLICRFDRYGSSIDSDLRVFPEVDRTVGSADGKVFGPGLGSAVHQFPG